VLLELVHCREKWW